MAEYRIWVQRLKNLLNVFLPEDIVEEKIVILRGLYKEESPLNDKEACLCIKNRMKFDEIARCKKEHWESFCRFLDVEFKENSLFGGEEC